MDLSRFDAAFSVRGANLTGDVGGMTDPEMRGLLWHLVGLGLLIMGLYTGRVVQWVVVLGGVIAIWSYDHVGHVSGRDTILQDFALVLHLLAVAL